MIETASIFSRTRILLKPLSFAIVGAISGAWFLWADTLPPYTLELAAFTLALGLTGAIWAAACANATLQTAHLDIPHYQNAGKHPATAPSRKDRTDEGMLTTWSKQVELAHYYTDKTITTLAARFTDLAARTETAISTYQNTGSGLAMLLDNNRHALDSMGTSLRASGKDSVLHETLELSSLIEQLQTMVKDMSDVARQTKLLALNSAIIITDPRRLETSLVPTATELRRLADLMGDTEKKIGEVVAAINQGIANTQAISQQYAQYAPLNDAPLAPKHAPVISNLGTTISKVMGAALVLREESESVGNEIALLLLVLQFQNRVSHALDHINNDLGKLGFGVSEQTITQEVMIGISRHAQR